MHSLTARRLSALCVLASGLFLAACSDSPTARTINAPQFPETTASEMPPAPPGLSSVTIGTPGTTGSEFPDASARAALASATAAALQIGGQGMICNVGPGLHIRAPRPQGTQNMVQSFETAWWYPRIWKYDGRQWIHHGDVGFISAKLPSANPQWTIHQNNEAVGDNLVVNNLPDGYYAVQSYMYFGGSQLWASQWENAVDRQTPIQFVALNRQWCQTMSPQRPGT